MSKSRKSANDGFAKIAAAFIYAYPSCRVIYGFDQDEDRNVLKVVNTGLYLRDIRDLLPDNFELKYGSTQDTIIFIDKNHE